MSDLCKICEKRRPRRFCPGVKGDICTQCCGTEREVTVDCPFDCEYLLDAREYERLPQLAAEAMPNRDIEVTESFLRSHDDLIMAVSGMLLESAMEVPGIVDNDLHDAIEALIKTARTLNSGLIYASRPDNALAAQIQERFDQRMTAFREQMTAQQGMNTLRDTEVLGALAFLQRLEMQHNNGRRKGRAFVQFLLGYFVTRARMMQEQASPAASPIQ